MELEHNLDSGESAAPNTKKRMVLMLVGTAILLGLITGYGALKGFFGKGPMGPFEPPQTVTATEAHLEEWQPSLGAVGTVRAIHGADLAFEVAGAVTEVDVAPGAEVKKGQPLVHLNDTAEQAQLQQLLAASALAELNFKRAKDQMAARIISQAEFDAAEADLKAKSSAAGALAALAAKKHLVAPFAGRVGLVGPSPGAYLETGAAVLTLQQVDPVYVDFFLPQKELSNVRIGQKVMLGLDAYPNRTFTGKVTAVNSKVDLSTRNVEVEATFPNPDRVLIPGMFVNVHMDVGSKNQYLTLPQTAITYNPYGAVVFVAIKSQGQGPGGKTQEMVSAQQVFVTTGPSRGDQVAILKGIEPGAKIITSGGLKLRNGTPLIIDNRIQPANDPHPAPQEQ